LTFRGDKLGGSGELNLAVRRRRTWRSGGDELGGQEETNLAVRGDKLGGQGRQTRRSGGDKLAVSGRKKVGKNVRERIGTFC
jgi:hypothetical protein